MKKVLFVIFAVFLSGCAEEAGFTIDNKTVIVQPYGWADYHVLKNDSIIYRVNVSNVVLSIVFSETIFIPVWLTGWQFYEPIRKVDPPKAPEITYR
jgi:hypothetical protein